jgi:DNA polymerase III epsilon subunit-like protein
MDTTYLFFDIECANCFDGKGKMCSFGYVLTDGQFTVIESDDIVINPEAEFDWYLFSPKNRCPLAYSKEYFRRQHNFKDYYKQIKTLLTAPFRKVVGFSSGNDVAFIITACERYNLPLINFAAYDAEPVLNTANNIRKGLAAWAEFYHIDTTELHAHRSSDDAMMTMLVVKALCTAQRTELGPLLDRNKNVLLPVEKIAAQQKEQQHRRALTKEIEGLYGKKDRCPRSTVLAGGQYALSFKLGKKVDEAYRIAQLVYTNGGILSRHLKDSGTLIQEKEVALSGSVSESDHGNIKTISTAEFCALIK